MKESLKEIKTYLVEGKIQQYFNAKSEDEALELMQRYISLQALDEFITEIEIGE